MHGTVRICSKILQKYGMAEANAVSTPVDSNVKLTKATEETCEVDKNNYQSAVGSLLYVSTRPDIALAVSSVAKFCNNPTSTHWTAVNRIFRYVKGTKDYMLRYHKGGTMDCTGYSDADWAGDGEDRKSLQGTFSTLVVDL